MIQTLRDVAYVHMYNICVYVCIYIYICIYIHIHIHVCM